MAEDIEISHLRKWIGRQDRESDCLTPALLKRFRATLGGLVQTGTAPDSQLPLGIHWCLALPAVSADDLGVDGHPAKGGFIPPVPLPRRMWASSRIQFHRAPDVGATIERTSTIADVALKESSASGPLVFVHIDHAFTQGCGLDSEMLIEERQSIVYRRPSAFKRPEPPAIQAPREPVQIPPYLLTTTPDINLLFRYSGMTFNAHRIHYDHQYAIIEEGYPGLVVHGPLMATLLMNLAQASRPEHSLRTFEFRGVAPAFVDQALTFSIADRETKDHPGAESLEVRNHEGALVMTARAQFA